MCKVGEDRKRRGRAGEEERKGEKVRGEQAKRTGQDTGGSRYEGKKK